MNLYIFRNCVEIPGKGMKYFCSTSKYVECSKSCRAWKINSRRMQASPWTVKAVTLHISFFTAFPLIWS